MPQIIIHYTGQLDQETDMQALCRKLADTMLTVKDDEEKQVFPTGGVRVMAYPCLLYTSPSPRDYAASRMPSSA